MRVLMNIEQEKAQLDSEIMQVQTRVNTLQTTIAQWDVHPFYKKKLRENSCKWQEKMMKFITYHKQRRLEGI